MSGPNPEADFSVFYDGYGWSSEEEMDHIYEAQRRVAAEAKERRLRKAGQAHATMTKAPAQNPASASDDTVLLDQFEPPTPSWALHASGSRPNSPVLSTQSSSSRPRSHGTSAETISSEANISDTSALFPPTSSPAHLEPPTPSWSGRSKPQSSRRRPSSPSSPASSKTTSSQLTKRIPPAPPRKLPSFPKLVMPPSVPSETRKGALEANATKRPHPQDSGTSDTEGATTPIESTPSSSKSASGPPVKKLKSQADIPALASSSKIKLGPKRSGMTLKQAEKAKKDKEANEVAIAKRSLAEYAEYLASNVPSGGGPAAIIFKEMRFFYHGNNKDPKSKGRMDFMHKKGAKLMSSFDPKQVTHVISEYSTEKVVLAALGLKSFEELPITIPILDYEKWVIPSATSKLCLPTLIMDKFVAQRHVRNKPGRRQRDASKSTAPVASNRDPSDDSRSERDSDEEIDLYADDVPESPIEPVKEAVTPTLAPPDRKGSTDSQVVPPTEDETTLEYWVNIAQNLEMDPYSDEEAQADNEDDNDDDDNATDDDEADVPLSKKKKWAEGAEFACKDVGFASNGASPNQDVIDELLKLSEFHQNSKLKDDNWRAMQYNKAIASLRRHPTRIKSVNEAQSLPNIGEKTAKKIMEFINNGSIKRLAYEQDSEEAISAKIFSGIYGVGPTKARAWFSRGLRTLDDVREGKGGVTLSSAQQLGLTYYDDLALRMPREEAKVIFDQIRDVALSIDKTLILDIMGSYRRGQETCGDLDILLTRSDNDGKTHAGILRKLLPKLRQLGILTADLSMPGDFDDEEAKYMGLCRLGLAGKMRRIDILTIPYCQWGAALIYFTGDDIFNRSIRLLARRKGYSLNQRGLWKDVIRDRTTNLKSTTGTIIASRTEREIFDILGVPWQEPPARRRLR